MGMVILIIHLGSREVSHRAYVLDTDAFELMVGTDFIVHHPEVKALTLTQPYHLVVDHGYGPEELPLQRCSKQPYDLHLIETLGSEEHRMCSSRLLGCLEGNDGEGGTGIHYTHQNMGTQMSLQPEH